MSSEELPGQSPRNRPKAKRRHFAASRQRFIARVGYSLAVAAIIVCFSLGIGAAGYHFFGALGWLDALLNASMILAGMGPVDPMQSTAGKLFATFYALYSGIAFLSITAIVLAPVMHRVLHRFHLELEEDAESKNES